MKEDVVAEALADRAGMAMAKPKVVRAPKKRSIVRPVIWSTKGSESWEMEEVASSACVEVDRRNAERVRRRMSKARMGLMPRYEGCCSFENAMVASTVCLELGLSVWVVIAC